MKLGVHDPALKPCFDAEGKRSHDGARGLATALEPEHDPSREQPLERNLNVKLVMVCSVCTI